MRINSAVLSEPTFLEGLYQQWKEDPDSLEPSWRFFFQGFDLASCPRTCVAAEQARDQSRVASVIYNYRDQGYRGARTNPLQDPPDVFDLSLESFGFESKDLDRVFDTGHLGGPQRATLREIIQILRQTYCGSIGVEYLHIDNVQIRRWLQREMEPNRNQPEFERQIKQTILEQLIDAELFETFIHRHYLGQKRFSLEGGETLIPMLHIIIEQAPELGVEEIVLGMSHRGRLNVLANLLDKSYATIFSEFEDNFIAGSVAGDGDVKYHKGYTSDHQNRFGHRVHVSLTANPSHLEAVDPVVLGRARAKQRQRGDTELRKKVLPVLVHGDAAFCGQGIVAETFNMSRLEGYKVGGTLHVVINNQIGFTTSPAQARSSYNVTDVAKMVGAPIFHVNGDDPEAAVYAAELAFRFRQEFRRDVVLELVCYRRHGHNESDEPAFTQPRLYRDIKSHVPVRTLYTKQLLESGDLTSEENQCLTRQFQSRLEEAFRAAREGKPDLTEETALALWTGLHGPYVDTPVETAVSYDTLLEVAKGITSVPDEIRLSPKVQRLLPKRLTAVEKRTAIDWSLGEALSFGTLLIEGIPVRLSGQDSERGTFSQRHAVLRDIESEEKYVPLNQIRPHDQAHFCVYNSPLSEASVLGFDYGYSLSEPRMLILWEAQFGDFVNGAQVIIDQFLVAASAKWGRSSGLVLLLPHGYEGQGPEHSNAYLERYLTGCADNNIQVCYPSTPAQYFHVLRRQIKRSFRRPLILMTPKSLLRLPQASSRVDDFVEGSCFQEIISEPPNKDVRRLILCTGKIFYDLRKEYQERKGEGVSIIRIEQLYPFPERQLREAMEAFSQVETIVWAQEEPENRGAFRYIQLRLSALFPDRPMIEYAGRPASASPATGSLKSHKEEQARVVRKALWGE